jgi:hypothetical protein
MRQAAVEAYKRGQLHFADLMLARQTYASLKTEDIQIRQEIVNAHLAGLRDQGNPDEGPMTGASSPAPANPAPTSASSPSHPLGSPDSPVTPAVGKDQKDPGITSPAIPLATPAAVMEKGDGEKEAK